MEEGQVVGIGSMLGVTGAAALGGAATTITACLPSREWWIARECWWCRWISGEYCRW